MSRSYSQKGVSLVEVLIALLIGLIVASALAAIFAQSIKTRAQANRDSQKLENGRYALETIGDDIRLAGYFGELTLPPSTAWQTPNPCETAVANLGWNAASSQIPVPLFGYEAHGGATPAIPSCSGAFLPDRKPNTDIIVVRRVSTDDPVAPATVSGAAHLQVSTQSSFCPPTDGAKYAVSSSSSGLNLHQIKKGDCSVVAKARKLIVRTYYIATCNVCTPTSDHIPTLKVAELDGAAISYRSITPGIDDLHVEYGVDSAATDGSTDEYLLSANNNTNNTLSVGKNWSDVVAVRVFVLAKDLDATTGYASDASYKVGSKVGGVDLEFTVVKNDDRAAPPDGTPGPDNYKRTVMATTVRAVNAAGRRGAP